MIGGQERAWEQIQRVREENGDGGEELGESWVGDRKGASLYYSAQDESWH